MTMTTGSGRRLPVSIDKELVLRSILLLAAAVLALVFANTAASLFQVWELDPGSSMPSPWRGLLDADQVTEANHLVALLGTAFFAGASLSCLVFLLERLLRDGWAWVRDRLGL